MSNERRPSRANDYRAARIGAAGALTATLVVLLLADASSVDYEVSATTLGTLATMILILLGIEAANILRGKP